MCGVSSPTYTKPTERQRERAPDQAALYVAAQRRAAERGGGAQRRTINTSASGVRGPVALAQAQQTRQPTVLG